MPASTASGTCAASGAATSTTSQQRERVHDAGHRRGGAGAHVGHRARDRAGGRDAAEERRHEVGDALRHQLLVGVVARLRRSRLSATRAHSSDSIAPSSAMVTVGITSCLAVFPAERRQRERRQRAAGCRRSACRWSPPAGRSSQRDQRQRHQRDDRARARAPRCAACGPRAPPTGSTLPREQARPHEQASTQVSSPSASACGLNAVRRAAPAPASCEKKSAGILAIDRPEQVAQLRQRDQHRDAVGEADHDRHRHVAHQRAELEQPHQRTAARRRSAVAISRLVRP